MRGALARVATAVTAMVALSFVLPLGLLNGQMARERALTNAERQASSLVPVLTVTSDPAQLAAALGSIPAGAAGVMALHLPTGEALGVPHAPPADLARAHRLKRAFFADAPGGRVLLRPVVLDAERTAVVEVFASSAELTRGVAKSWTILALVALALVGVSVAMADRLALRVVSATDRLARALNRVAGGDLTARTVPGGPRELRAAGEAFNHMVGELARLLAAEREAGADLSHRLRTPLTALRVNLDGMAAHPGDPARLAQSREALGRLEDAVSEIIATARGMDGERPAVRSCDAVTVVKRRLEFWSALAEDQERPWDLVAPDDHAPVPIPAAELSAVVDALLGNVFRHTPHGTAFQLSLHRGEQATGLLVGDAGPGIAEPGDALRRGASGGGSTGLGLDIARRLAESTGGSLRVGRSMLGGAQIEVWLRTAPRAAPRRAVHRSGRRGARWSRRGARSGSENGLREDLSFPSGTIQQWTENGAC
ncbi:HAMP domain-containing histidine kinase [Actinocorallia sp. API 0066]|uniref:sensor histidine kinase n=1 Tax=Actinocorallia sp. API 0066 TaxID=2896846 RepID=UPI001E2CFC61|nr:HAMP domain-containing sensor histidine kinase [Actinocorallia sp. API 0066]MCD0452659.1 HAMP domain-containing histidine kinase [Actinocorallia sp. API 0066]